MNIMITNAFMKCSGTRVPRKVPFPPGTWSWLATITLFNNHVNPQSLTASAVQRCVIVVSHTELIISGSKHTYYNIFLCISYNIYISLFCFNKQNKKNHKNWHYKPSGIQLAITPQQLPTMQAYHLQRQRACMLILFPHGSIQK